MMMTHLPNETISQSSSVHISVDTSTQHKKSLQDIHEEESFYVHYVDAAIVLLPQC